MTNFRELLGALHLHQVQYVLTGGMAAIPHGAGRVTEDLNVVYERFDKNRERLVDALSPHAPYLRGVPAGLPFKWDAQTLKRGLNFTLDTSLRLIDLLGEIAGGGTFETLSPRAVNLTLFGFNVRCISLEQLSLSKRAAGRPKDRQANAELELLFENTHIRDRDRPAS